MDTLEEEQLKKTQSESSSWSGHNQGTAAEVDTIGAQFGPRETSACQRHYFMVQKSEELSLCCRHSYALMVSSPSPHLRWVWCSLLLQYTNSLVWSCRCQTAHIGKGRAAWNWCGLNYWTGLLNWNTGMPKTAVKRFFLDMTAFSKVVTHSVTSLTCSMLHALFRHSALKSWGRRFLPI